MTFSETGGVLQGGDKDKCTELEGGGDRGGAKLGQVVPERASYFLDEAMDAETLETASQLALAEMRQAAAQVFGTEAADAELALREGLKEMQVRTGKQIEPAIGAFALALRCGDLLDVLQAGRGIINGCQEVEVRLPAGLPSSSHAI